MEEELVTKIKVLKAIKPDPEWKTTLKSQLFFSSKIQPSGLKPEFSFWKMVLSHKLAFALASIAILVMGSIILFLSWQALPGELLFSVKKTAEQVSFALTPENEKLKAELLVVKQRLDELEIVSKESEGQKLASALQQYKEATAKAAKNISQKTDAIVKDKELVKEIALRVQGVKQREENLEQVLAIDISAGEELEESAYSLLYKSMAQDLIEKLSSTSLAEEQRQNLERAKELFNQGNYQSALEILVLLSQDVK